MGTFGSYYSYTFLEPVSQETKGDTMTASFRLPESGSQQFLRAQNPDASPTGPSANSPAARSWL